ncbi:MAG: hypothetical protein ABIH11_00435 [Candidatus Altiarchaeota archaeon]
MKTKKWAMFAVLASTFITSFGQIFLKKGAMSLSLNPLDVILNVPLWVGSIFYGLGAIILILSLKHGELSVLYPIYALNFIWVSVLSPWVYSTDAMNPVKWAGVAVIMIGVSIVGYGSGKGGES